MGQSQWTIHINFWRFQYYFEHFLLTTFKWESSWSCVSFVHGWTSNSHPQRNESFKPALIVSTETMVSKLFIFCGSFSGTALPQGRFRLSGQGWNKCFTFNRKLIYVYVRSQSYRHCSSSMKVLHVYSLVVALGSITWVKERKVENWVGLSKRAFH